ncbi:GNAT family N-acetyltransferase [Solwaraspora sp. WMMB335]|uniref:GNAT family N-acetyltransferase n=1 Tax=Solwaraspora sp. WMMB335 TaxID=3404118 RepID=UPI003B925C49
MTTAKIRKATPQDVAQLATLIGEIERFYGASHIQDYEERVEQVREALFGVPPIASVLIAEDDRGQHLGLAAYSYLWPAAGSTHSLFLKELFVREPGRRRGIGSQLVSRLRQIAAERPGCTRMEWNTDRDNPAARSFYQSLGFPEHNGKIVYRITC